MSLVTLSPLFPSSVYLFLPVGTLPAVPPCRRMLTFPSFRRVTRQRRRSSSPLSTVQVPRSSRTSALFPAKCQRWPTEVSVVEVLWRSWRPTSPAETKSGTSSPKKRTSSCTATRQRATPPPSTNSKDPSSKSKRDRGEAHGHSFKRDTSTNYISERRRRTTTERW